MHAANVPNIHSASFERTTDVHFPLTTDIWQTQNHLKSQEDEVKWSVIGQIILELMNVLEISEYSC
jgi:hypothetical protein